MKLKINNHTGTGLLGVALLVGVNCPAAIAQPTAVYPFSDPTNSSGWVLNQAISDEFDGTNIDKSKWFVEGESGDYYIWKGRSPSQFAPHNVRVEDGKLKLRTQWEPDYPFAQEEYKDGGVAATYGKFEGKPMPITTAGVISRKRFLNGYMEIRSKCGNAAITAAFWGIGYQQELDVYEQMGNPKKKGNIRADSSLSTAHDWSPPAVRPTQVFDFSANLPYRTADGFHVYGAEWGVDYLKLFIDGRLVHSFTQDDVGMDWVLNNPMEVWLDSEIFQWLGMPDQKELPVDFEVDYVRVWQKPDPSLLDRAFFGFEGPKLYENNPRPLKLVPESSVPNDYQKFWLIEGASTNYLSIVKGDYARGLRSLKFSGFGKNEKLETPKVIALTPEGALDIPAGDFILSLKLWLDQGRVADKIHIAFTDPPMDVTFDNLAKLERRQWVTVEKKISRPAGSSPKDQFRIEIRRADLPETKAAKLYIDDIAIEPVKP